MLRGILASVAFGVAASGLAQPSLVEYPAETSTFFPPTPTGIASGPSGLVWFVNFNAAHSIGTVTLDGDTTGIAQPPGDVATGAITGAPATYLWAGGSKNILKITRDPTPTFGVTFALSPVPDASLFHSIDSIAWDGASTVWFTDFVGGARKLGRLDTTSGSVQESALSNDCMFPAGFGRDMVRASDGNVWFMLSSGACKILADGSVLLQPLTSPAGGITSGPDGRIWVAEYTGTAHLEAFDPHGCPGAACQIATYDLPSPVHDLHGLAAGPDDRIWFVSHGAPDVAGSVKTDGSDFQFVALPSGSKPGENHGRPGRRQLRVVHGVGHAEDRAHHRAGCVAGSVSAERPLQGGGLLERSRPEPQRSGHPGIAHRRHGLFLVLQQRQRRARHQGPGRDGRQPALLGLLRGSLQRRLHDHGDRYENRRGRTYENPITTSLPSRTRRRLRRARLRSARGDDRRSMFRGEVETCRPPSSTRSTPP